MDISNHWRYFLALEKEFDNSLRFVEYTEQHKNVYSFEFARLLLLTCSELDTLFKIICQSLDPNSKADSISQYFEPISTKYDIFSEEVIIKRYSIEIKPFETWSTENSPTWWTSYNKVKHRRHEEFHQANLVNTLHSLAGLFVLNLIALNEFNLLQDTYDRPILLDRYSSPGALMLEAGYKVKLI